jgi:hypothetical protein
METSVVTAEMLITQQLEADTQLRYMQDQFVFLSTLPNK